ncbi:MAG: acyltransferase family protein [Actinobacteria bacterium]|nr:acyltransferase family protein [Actinomycetota bacterium]
MSQTSRSSDLGYQPALDGVRAVSVVMVLLFHAGFAWMGGGYLGVSIFFTLSGFLITTLLLVEAERTGAVSFRRFYSRRLKRLLPASLLCLVGIVVVYWSGEFRLVPDMRGQLWGALGQIYNWVRIDGSSSYADLFGKAPVLVSPLEHYWSLAIEEQFYVVWPLTAWFVIRGCRRRGADVALALLMLAGLFAVASPLISAFTSPKFGYWSTPTRLGELLIGASAAAWHHRGGRLPSWSRWLALSALAALVVLAARLPVGSGPAYTGWMTPIALVSATLILSLQVPGATRALLSLPPVVWIGRVSYGLYLYHWPVFVLLRTHGWQLDRPPGLALAIAVTVAIAGASFYLVEQPVRRAVWPPRRTFVAATSGAIVAAIAILVMPVSRGFLEADQQTLDQAAIQPLDSVAVLVPATNAAPTTVVTTTVPALEPLVIALPAPPNRPVRILLVGDSTAFSVGQGVASWAVDNRGYAQLDVLWCAGCGFMRGGTITNYDGAEKRSAVVVGDELPRRVANLAPDLVVLMTSIDDIATRQWTQSEGALTPYDAAFRERMRQSYSDLTGELLAMGVPSVVWVVPPVPHGYWTTPELHEAQRYEVQHEVIREVVAGSPDAVSLVDLDGWMTRAGHVADESWRPDGTHFSEEAAQQLANEYLGPRLLLAALTV